MDIHIACDHAGFKVKELLKKQLSSEHHVIDLGTNSEESCQYPHIAIPLCREVVHHENGRGILICGTGIGVSMVANKFQGIRAALCHNKETVKLAREHNNSNVLCLGARISDIETIIDIVKIWIETEFEGGRHEERLKIFSHFGSEVD